VPDHKFFSGDGDFLTTLKRPSPTNLSDTLSELSVLNSYTAPQCMIVVQETIRKLGI